MAIPLIAGYLSHRWIMKRKGELHGDYINALPREVRASVMEYVLEEEERNMFRTQTPYRPVQSPIALKK